MLAINRRQALLIVSSTALGSRLLADDDGAGRTCTLGFGAYGLPGKTAEESLKLIAGAGYDSAELTITADRDSAPESMTKARRENVRKLLDDLGLRLTSLMEHVSPLGEESRNKAAMERLKRAGELGHDLSPGRPPVVQTVLGGKDWKEARPVFEARLPQWRDLAETSQTVICIKPHRGSALSRADDAAALLRHLGESPWLRMVYDYSHFAFRDMPLAETIETSLPFTAHIAVKDAYEHDGTVDFALPGSKGTIDYADMLRQFYAGGYRGDVCVEVSSRVWKQADYDLDAALTNTYRHMANAFRTANIPRPPRS